MLIGFSFEISVSNPARADNGTYQLVADNGRGTDERNFDIIVIGTLIMLQGFIVHVCGSALLYGCIQCSKAKLLQLVSVILGRYCMYMYMEATVVCEV